MTDITITPQEAAIAERLRGAHPHYAFRRAVRMQTRARAALLGGAGSGKTYTALVLASALGKSTAVIETVHPQAAEYADDFDFDLCPPLTFCSADALVAALAECQALGYETVIVDSYSLFWSGNGGIRDQANEAAKPGPGGHNAGWNAVRPYERRMWDALFAYDGHVIVTMRTKTDHVVEIDEHGRSAMRRFAGKPEHRDGAEHEFNFVGIMHSDHTLEVTKALSVDLADEFVNRPGLEFAAKVRQWLDAGEPLPPLTPVADLIAEARRPDATVGDLKALWRQVKDRFLDDVVMADDDGESLIALAVYIERRGKAMEELAGVA
ncbi:AAA family ATPase [Streptomyces europaeiscabiei]|uniref:AAA family ATPase n=1 Tax=Streptomyces europaeiscabiei TaxID=146819 RepID=UPI0029A2EDE5|nr:AAA family ATPase [Streptomyces europaeiscabiei]MDX3694880.1 AAA family ATPase [Streptomyces europaeiscabiei]